MALPKQVQKDIEEALTAVGLSPSETAVLLALSQSADNMRATELAKKTRLNRTTLYGITKLLLEKGLVSSVEERGVLRYRCIEPESLIDYIERTREKLFAGAEKVKRAIPVIKAQRTGDPSSYPTVQFFEGKEGIKQVYEDTIQRNKSKTLYGFLGADAVFKLMDSDWIEGYIGRRKKAGVFAHTILTDTETSRAFKGEDANQLRLSKMLPAGYNFDIEVIIYENKTLIVSFAEDYPLAVLMEDKKIADMMKTVFRYVDSTLSQ